MPHLLKARTCQRIIPVMDLSWVCDPPQHDYPRRLAQKCVCDGHVYGKRSPSPLLPPPPPFAIFACSTAPTRHVSVNALACVPPSLQFSLPLQMEWALVQTSSVTSPLARNGHSLSSVSAFDRAGNSSVPSHGDAGSTPPSSSRSSCPGSSGEQGGDGIIYKHCILFGGYDNVSFKTRKKKRAKKEKGVGGWGGRVTPRDHVSKVGSVLSESEKVLASTTTSRV